MNFNENFISILFNWFTINLYWQFNYDIVYTFIKIYSMSVNQNSYSIEVQIVQILRVEMY